MELIEEPGFETTHSVLWTSNNTMRHVQSVSVIGDSFAVRVEMAPDRGQPVIVEFGAEDAARLVLAMQASLRQPRPAALRTSQARSATAANRQARYYCEALIEVDVPAALDDAEAADLAVVDDWDVTLTTKVPVECRNGSGGRRVRVISLDFANLQPDHD